jgi:pimeloyl-ACP methyl ester carboxylesterase
MWGPSGFHYIEQGDGEPLVLLHGNSGMIQDFTSSGLVERAAQKYRVIVFDRADWTGAEANVVPQKRYGSKSHLGLRVS